ncbi:FecR family protein [Flavisphingomonas formosensis]|uniref:FecR family protein n=1 Tax=Flavisphingomonas formosensis TaxID=861534 RepID=UPI0012FBC462|nr:FecR domain-containing protein [Sphingomonas formosensis]
MKPTVNGMPAHLKAEAAAWLARLHSDERTARDEAGFQLWLTADPRNREAFGLVTAAWDEAGGAGIRHQPPANSWTRRKLLGVGAVATLAAAGAGVMMFDIPDRYETGRGEQRRIVLADGSILLLDTDSAVRVTMAADRRLATLDRGRAHFQLDDDPLRPFLVKSGGYDILSQGAALDVDGRQANLSLLVIEGTVRIRPAGDPATPLRQIGPRERVQASAGHSPSVDSPSLAPLVAWQTGRAIFAALPLRNAVAEMNRYGMRPIVIVDPGLASARVSGSFELGDSGAFARSAARQLKVPLRIDAQEIAIGHA